MKQLDLFSLKSRSDDWRRPIPKCIDFGDFTPVNWMYWLVEAQCCLIFLYDTGNGSCNPRSGDSWEGRIQNYVDGVSVSQQEAERFLRNRGYVRHSRYTHGSKKAIVYRSGR